MYIMSNETEEPPPPNDWIASTWEDSPLREPNQDVLGRRDFSERLAASFENLATEESIVVGLDGPWGSGKSTILNFVESMLDAGDVLPVRFNPWLVGSDETTLVREFITTLGTALDKNIAPDKEKFSKIADRASSILRLGGAIPVVGGALKIAGDVAGELGGTFEASIADFRDSLESALREQKKSLLVIIDDLDRLSDAQLGTMFRLVKAVGVFPRTRYLLAFDRKVVEAALDRTSAGGGRFLDKIVQLSIPVPEAPYPSILAVFDNYLSGLRTQIGGHVVDAEWTLRKRTLDRYLAEHLATVRDAKRLGYTVEFHSSGSGHTLDELDLASFHALRQFSPRAADRLTAVHPSELSEQGADDILPDEGPWSDRTVDLVRSLLVQQRTDAERAPLRFATRSGRDRFLADPGVPSDDEVRRWVRLLFENQATESFSRWLVAQNGAVAQRAAEIAGEVYGDDLNEAQGLSLALTSQDWLALGQQNWVISKIALSGYVPLILEHVDLRLYIDLDAALKQRASQGHRPWENEENKALAKNVLRKRMAGLSDAPIWPDESGWQGSRQELLRQWVEVHGRDLLFQAVEHDLSTFVALRRLFPHEYSQVDELVEILGRNNLESLLTDTYPKDESERGDDIHRRFERWKVEQAAD